MISHGAFSKRNLAIYLAIGAVCMTVLSARLLFDAASLSFSVRRLAGLTGILLANSLILSFVAIKAVLSDEHEPASVEKAVLLVLSLFTGASLLTIHLDQ